MVEETSKGQKRCTWRTRGGNSSMQYFALRISVYSDILCGVYSTLNRQPNVLSSPVCSPTSNFVRSTALGSQNPPATITPCRGQPSL